MFNTKNRNVLFILFLSFILIVASSCNNEEQKKEAIIKEKPLQVSPNIPANHAEKIKDKNIVLIKNKPLPVSQNIPANLAEKIKIYKQQLAKNELKSKPYLNRNLTNKNLINQPFFIKIDETKLIFRQYERIERCTGDQMYIDFYSNGIAVYSDGIAGGYASYDALVEFEFKNDFGTFKNSMSKKEVISLVGVPSIKEEDVLIYNEKGKELGEIRSYLWFFFEDGKLMAISVVPKEGFC